MYETSQEVRKSFLQEINAGFFGEYLISQGLIQRDQLDEALSAQKQLKRHLKIGELLVKRDALKAEDLLRALKDYRVGIRLGELLIHQGDIGFLQLLEALDHQQRTSQQLGESLVALGYCSQEQIEEVLLLQRSLQNAKLED
ncbi:MAG TPA: hypothetical protein V6D47_15710 [Oscillatoriaceae cyanobacterium]